MKILTRYIRQNIVRSILVVILVLLALEIFVQFFNEFSFIGVGNYDVFHAIGYVLLLLPQNIYQFFPMAGLLGCLLGLGQLASHSELIVMRTGGVSLARIAWMVLQAALILLVVAFILGEIIAPMTEHAATTFKTAAVSKGQALRTRRGTWIHSGKDFIHIGAIVSKGKIKDITRYRFDNNSSLKSVSFAKYANYINGVWLFSAVKESIFKGNKILSGSYSTQDWSFNFKPKLLGLTKIDAAERSLPQLYSYIDYLHKSGLRATKYAVIFWQRIMQPFATLVMIMLAIPFIFGPLRTVPMGLRILVGVIVGFAFFIINQFIGIFATVYQLPAMYIAVLPTLLVAILGCVLLSFYS